MAAATANSCERVAKVTLRYAYSFDVTFVYYVTCITSLSTRRYGNHHNSSCNNTACLVRERFIRKLCVQSRRRAQYPATSCRLYLSRSVSNGYRQLFSRNYDVTASGLVWNFFCYCGSNCRLAKISTWISQDYRILAELGVGLLLLRWLIDWVIALCWCRVSVNYPINYWFTEKSFIWLN